MIRPVPLGESIIIVGAGEHARVALDVCEAAGLAIAGFIDPRLPCGTLIQGLPVFGGDELLRDEAFVARHRFLPGIGSEALRLKTSRIVSNERWITVAHPAASVSPRAQLDVGILVSAGSVINTDSKIGRFCIINTHASVDHDCCLEDGVQIGPGAILCGRVSCGLGAFVGAGAVILPGLRIGAGAIVGAGAVVTRSIEEATTVAGNPARPFPLKSRP